MDTIPSSPTSPSGMPKETRAVMPTQETSWGAIVGIVIVVAILIIGTFYFWGKELDESGTLPPVEENVTGEDILNRPDPVTEALKEQGTSDDISSIEADLSATDLSGLDTELENIDAELSR
ncbi:MAG: hypothetical protein HGB03_04210 [Candidatus Yonathbacteria bacterium]|nr:hypothetical protein [Candidatus Yonathbacteria bacterium]NTW47568.1 hypothetical protein [Candidatus Yonathbacteria bacterium]